MTIENLYSETRSFDTQPYIIYLGMVGIVAIVGWGSGKMGRWESGAVGWWDSIICQWSGFEHFTQDPLMLASSSSHAGLLPCMSMVFSRFDFPRIGLRLNPL